MHTKPNNGATDEWLTPPYIVKALGKFDLDPCAHLGQFFQTAKRMIALPEDGLKAEWKGRVFLNPPYGSKTKRWLQKMANHGNGIVPARTEVVSWFWPYVWEMANAVLFIRGRLYYHRPDGTLGGNAGHGSVLVAYGKGNVKKLYYSGINGRFIHLRRACNAEAAEVRPDDADSEVRGE